MSKMAQADALTRMTRAYLDRREHKTAAKVLDQMEMICPGHPELRALQNEVRAMREDFRPRPVEGDDGRRIRDTVQSIAMEGFARTTSGSSGPAAGTGGHGGGPAARESSGQFGDAATIEGLQALAEEPQPELLALEPAAESGAAAEPSAELASLLHEESLELEQAQVSTDLVVISGADAGNQSGKVRLSLKNSTLQTIAVGYRYDGQWKSAGYVPPGAEVTIGTTSHDHSWRAVGHQISHEWAVDQAYGAEQMFEVRPKVC